MAVVVAVVAGLLLFVTVCINGYDTSTLQFVHVIWRHGDRSPGNGTFPTDIYNKESTWPQGWGELTQTGMTQHYLLGRYLRTRYSGFLSDRYSKFEIYIRSTGYNRTIMSAMANMAGFYTPNGSQIWNPTIKWQPVPVHSRPKQEDTMLYMRAKCPTAEKLQSDVMHSAEVQKIEQENKEFFDFLKEKTKYPLQGLGDFWHIYDPLNCEMKHKDQHPWPKWMNMTVYENIKKISDISTKFYYYTPKIQRFRGGLLLGDILHRMQQRQLNQTNLLDNRLKYYVYSAHDTTVTALLQNLGAFNSINPPYTATVLLELHKRDGEHVVELWYKNETDKMPYRLSISECSEPCTLEKFASRSAHLIAKDWHSECGLPSSNDGRSWLGISEQTWLYISLVVLCLLTLLVMVLSIILVLMVRERRNKFSRRHGMIINQTDDSDTPLSF